MYLTILLYSILKTKACLVSVLLFWLKGHALFHYFSIIEGSSICYEELVYIYVRFVFVSNHLTSHTW